MTAPSSRRERLAAARLYLLATTAHARLPLVEAVAAACRGGVSVVQVRDKHLADDEFLAVARDLRAVTREAGALLLVNDRVHLAAECGADGAHVGPGDLPPQEARAALGAEAILGVTTHDLEQARRAAAGTADYVGIGPVYPTATKGTPVRVIGPEAAGAVSLRLPLPAFAIGGITPANVRRAADAGCSRFAVCAALLGADDPEGAARALLAALDRPAPAPGAESTTGLPLESP